MKKTKKAKERAKAKFSKGKEILAEMELHRGYRVKDMIAELPCLAVDRTVWNSSMVTSVLCRLVGEGKLTRTEIKGERWYKLPE